jgi:FkbH-like protein
MLSEQQIAKAKMEEQSIKCVVWDLDNTLWKGTLLEDDTVSMRPEVLAIIQELDRRGILNSIASRNDYDAAVNKLQEFGLKEYFLYPEINWNSKSASLEAIAKSLNLALDTFAFIDDQPFEREEVAFAHPEVMCIDAADMLRLLDMPRMMPRFITSESQLRRQMYQSDMQREKAEVGFKGSNEEFLATLGMAFTIKPAEESDLKRAEEITVRTHQLNTTGYTYSYDELNVLRQSQDHLLLIASLEDKYGPYGAIGLALVELGKVAWTIKLLLMSCRVMSRGVGTIMMSYIMSRAKKANGRLRAHFIPNGRNRMMYVTYKFGGFKEIEQEGDLIILENDLTQIQPFPNYVQVSLPDTCDRQRHNLALPSVLDE